MSKKNRKQPNRAASGNIASGKSAPSAVKTVETEKKRCLFEYIVVNIICLFIFMAFGYIAIMSFFQTSVIDPSNYASEVILYQTDILILNLLVTALFFVILFALKPLYNLIDKVNLLYLEIGLGVYAFIIGMFWIFSVNSIPAADSQNIFETATNAAQNNYYPFENFSQFYNRDFYNGFSYFNFYPFQLGFVFICELVYRVFGVSSSMPVQVLNVIGVSLAYVGLARITRLLFKKKSIEFGAILMLGVCFQPILLCTFVYGNILGMSAAIWASLFLIKYFQTEKYVWLIPSGCLLIFSVLAKYNNMIYLVAFCIMLLIHGIKTIVQKTGKERIIKSVISHGMIAVLVLGCVGSIKLIIFSYEQRANVDLEDGVSQAAYLDMGLTESYMAPGWYTRTGLELYLNNNLDGDTATAQAWSDIGTKLDALTSDPEKFLDFFSKKILSQWNETTFESIWVSKVKGHTDNNIGWLGTQVYDKSFGQMLEIHFNLFMQVLYLLFAAGIYFMFIHKKSSVETVLLPLVVLGGFAYHLLFEGKSQYVLTYIPLLIPTAAFALDTIQFGKYEKLKELIKKINRITEHKPSG